MKIRWIVIPFVAAPCVVAMPIPFAIKMIIAATLGYLSEWMFEYLDDHTKP